MTKRNNNNKDKNGSCLMRLAPSNDRDCYDLSFNASSDKVWTDGIFNGENAAKLPAWMKNSLYYNITANILSLKAADAILKKPSGQTSSCNGQ